MSNSLKPSEYRILLDNLSLEKQDKDLTMIYDKIVKMLSTKSEFTRSDMPFLNFLAGLKHDKEELIKFMMTHELKKKELDLKSSPSISRNVRLDD